MKIEMERKIENTGSKNQIILGDFNGHLDFLGEQKLDVNGDMYGSGMDE